MMVIISVFLFLSVFFEDFVAMPQIIQNETIWIRVLVIRFHFSLQTLLGRGKYPINQHKGLKHEKNVKNLVWKFN